MPPAKKTAESFEEKMKQWAKASASFSGQEGIKIQSTAIFLFRYLKGRVAQLVAECPEQPMLYCYSSDGTPLRTHVRVPLQVGPLKMRREGKQTKEFLAQVAFLRVIDAAGAQLSQALFAPPLPLVHSKTAEAIFACGQQFQTSLRSYGHLGIAVQWYCFDRAGYSALSRLFKQQHRHDAAVAIKHNPMRKLQRELEWVESAGCALHDGHNSLKWALECNGKEAKELLDSMWAIFVSMRNSYDLILEHIGSWVARNIVWKRPADCPPRHQLQQTWECLGVDPVFTSILADTLQLHWDFARSQLCVSADVQKDPKAMSEISGALLGLWKFKLFSDSRWITIGCNCRTMVAALLTGLPSLIHYVKQCSSSVYHLKGWSHLGFVTKRFMVLAALLAFVPDSAVGMIFEDARVARSADAIKDSMLSELAWLEGLDGSLWDTMAALFTPEDNFPASAIQSEVLHGAHAAAGYFHWKTLRRVHDLPWSIARGDQDANLEALKCGPRPTHPTASKIWGLLQAGYSRDKIKAGLELLLDAPWATAATEQGHSMGALVKRMHPECGLPSIITRSMLGGFRKLLPRLSAEQIQVNKLRAKLSKMSKRNTELVGARHILFGDLMKISSKWTRIGKRSQDKFRQRKVMKSHAKIWKIMPQKQKDEYEVRATIKRSQSASLLRADMEHATSARDLALQRLESSEDPRPPLALTSCQLTRSEMALLSEQWQWKAMDIGAATRHEEMDKWTAAPKPTCDEELETLEKYEVEDESWKHVITAPRPSWLSSVVYYRSHFKRSVWCIPSLSHSVAYKVMFLVQNPHQVYFAKMTHIAGGGGGVGLTGAGSSADVAPCPSGGTTTWKLSAMSYVDWSDFPRADMSAIMVRTSCTHTGKGLVSSSVEPKPLSDVLAGLGEIPKDPPSEARPKKKAKVDAGRFTPEQLAKFPWLAKEVKKASADDDEGVSASASKEGSVKGSTIDIVAKIGSDEPLDEADVLAIYKELEAQRSEVAAEVVEVDGKTAFRLTADGGEWTMKNLGMASNCIRGCTCGKDVLKWCKKYNLQDSASFSFSRYLPEGAVVLGKSWVSWMGHLYAIYISQAEDCYVYTQADLSGWTPSAAHKEVVDGLTRADARNRIQKLFGMKPRL